MANPTIVDALAGKTSEIKLYDGKGCCKLLDCMPRILETNKTTADYAIAAMARVSYGNLDLKTDQDDAKLISYLIENYHTSPLEGVKFKFLIQCPIYVARQLIRHRTAQVNEYSMRYSEAIDEFYFPELRAQDKVNKQQSVDTKFDAETESLYKNACATSANMITLYRNLIKSGVAREVSRSILCTAEMTKMIWCMDLHNLFKFLKLRCDRAHAQKEIADLAHAILKLIQPIVPAACAAFEKYWINSLTFTQEEFAMIKKSIDMSKLKKDIESMPSQLRKRALLAKLSD